MYIETWIIVSAFIGLILSLTYLVVSVIYRNKINYKISLYTNYIQIIMLVIYAL